MDSRTSKKGESGGAPSPPTEGPFSVNPTPEKLIDIEVDMRVPSSLQKNSRISIEFEQILSATDEKSHRKSLQKAIPVEGVTQVKKNLFGARSSKASSGKTSGSKSRISPENMIDLSKPNNQRLIVQDLTRDGSKPCKREVIEIEDEDTILERLHKSRPSRPFTVERTETIKSIVAEMPEPKPVKRRNPSFKKKVKPLVIPHPEGKRDIERSEYIHQLLKEYSAKTSQKRRVNPSTKISTEPICIIQKPDPEFPEKCQTLVTLLRSHLEEIEALQKHQESQLSHGISASVLQNLLGKRAPQYLPQTTSIAADTHPDRPTTSAPGPKTPETPNPAAPTGTPTTPETPAPANQTPEPRPKRAAKPQSSTTLHLDSGSSLLASAILQTGNSDLFKRILKWTLRNCRPDTLRKVEGRLGVRLKKKTLQGLQAKELAETGVLPARVVSAVRQLRTFAERVTTNAERSLAGFAGLGGGLLGAVLGGVELEGVGWADRGERGEKAG